MLSKIRDIMIVVNKGQIEQFKKIIPDGKNLGIKISYIEQSKPKGLPDAFIVSEKFIGRDGVALVLGDNFFYGQNLSVTLNKSSCLTSGAKILLHKVSKPELYGVVKIKNNKIKALYEKPKKFVSDLAITGLYFFDNDVVNYSKLLKPSKRKELEITDLLNTYRKKNKLNFDLLGRGTAWLDTGNIEDFYKATGFVSAIENRQGTKIACIEEIAYLQNWIGKKEIIKQIKFYGNCNYSKYLNSLIKI